MPLIKMNKYYFHIFSVVLLLTVGCSTSKNVIKSSNSKQDKQLTETQLTEDKKIEFEYLFIEGLKQKMNGNTDAAIQYFNGCLEIDPNSAASLYEMANIHASKGEFISAKLLLEKAIQINSSNKWYKLLLAQIFQNNKQYASASRVYKELIEQEPDNIDYYYMDAILLTSAEEFNEAIKTYNQLEEIVGFNEQVSLARQHLYRSAGKNKEAYKEIETLIKFNPSVPEYYGVLADMYKEDGNMNKALEYYQKVLENDPDNGFVHFSLATFHIQNNEKEKGLYHAKQGFSNPNVEIETKIQLYLMLSVSPDEMKISNDQIEELIQLIIKAHPKDSRSYSIQADFLIQNEKQAEATKYMLKALEIDPNTYPLWEQLIITYNQTGDFEKMVKYSNQAIKLFPSQPLMYVLNAVGNIQLKSYNKAIKSLESGLIYVADNKQLEAQFELYRAEAYYNLDNSKQAFTSFEKVIEIEPDNFMAMNNYAYYLSVRGEQLEKAEMLSGRVVQANPDNATYLDTHAWVLFKKKEYRLAKFYMDTALKNGGDKNPVVIEHYGDILIMLNDVEGALKKWNESLEMGNNSEILKQKIEEKRFIEGEE
ncbi:MAG: tetratricopeptide repeat protein [Prolixibacteraceae bacterium]|jgi:tetratricopeptide (TPR) repeat protein|nr:tetratricopeptide repeat protein [Prolixibacteraceae bacterium]